MFDCPLAAVEFPHGFSGVFSVLLRVDENISELHIIQQNTMSMSKHLFFKFDLYLLTVCFVTLFFFF